MQSLTFLKLYEYYKSKCNYASVCVLQLSCIDKFMYMRACLTSSINICMHACFARNCSEALSHCGHGHALTSVPNSLSLHVLSIKHWRQSTFTETPSIARHSREARRRRASMLVYIYIYTSIDARLWPASLLWRAVDGVLVKAL